MKLHSVLSLTEGGKVSYQAASTFLKRSEQVIQDHRSSGMLHGVQW